MAYPACRWESPRVRSFRRWCRRGRRERRGQWPTWGQTSKPPPPVKKKQVTYTNTPQEQHHTRKRNRSHTQTYDKNNTTNDHRKPPPSLNNDRRWPDFEAAAACERISRGVNVKSALCFSFYKILFHFTALLRESIILVCPPPTCNAYPIAILLHGHCAIDAPPPPTPPLCHITYTIDDSNIV